MPRVISASEVPKELVLGSRFVERVPEADQRRQRAEVQEILKRLRHQPGVILADEVGMGKTFVALAVAYSVAANSLRGPAVIMVPPNLVDKWEQDLKTFAELYLKDRQPVRCGESGKKALTTPQALRYGVARHSVDLMRLLDDRPRTRAHLIFLAQGAMTRRQGDKWVRLALVAETLRTHARGRATRLTSVRKQIHRFVAELLWAIGEERATDLGDELWQRLLRLDPEAWKDEYNASVRESRRLGDDPVPKAVLRALRRVDLKPLARALKLMPIRAVGGDSRVSERIKTARKALHLAERALWTELLARAKWRSPLLVMDEAHHLKNPNTQLARQLQSADLTADLSTGDGAMAKAFDRMLFLTATPFQLGHHELVQVLRRFGDIRWNAQELGAQDRFELHLDQLQEHLTNTQRGAVGLQRTWARLQPDDVGEDLDHWWEELTRQPEEALTGRQRAVVDAYRQAKESRDQAEALLRRWIVRHNKGEHWVDTLIARRQRVDGAAIDGSTPAERAGLPIPPRQLLPFFLAARSAVRAGHDLLGEALCSSYEAFRFTRQHQDLAKDDEGDSAVAHLDLTHASWYLQEFDRALTAARGSIHPKVAATVDRVVDLWEQGEKVLVFAFYRLTCRSLRVHISDEIERRLGLGSKEILEQVQRRFFDDRKSPGRRALDRELAQIVHAREEALDRAQIPREQREEILGVMRRFLRVPTTLVRCFPLDDIDTLEPPTVAELVLNHADGSGASWREKFDAFIDFLVQCSTDERALYLEAASRTETGTIRVEKDEDEDGTVGPQATLANVQVATGKTRRDARARLMRAFNTPFFPDILVCSEVMREGVDLQRFCRHVIHHDLAWNPSTIEQRTGRIDRLGCKAEGRQPIMVYLPYIAGTADERQYQVMSHREQWFRVVMGQDEVARLISPDVEPAVPLPSIVSAKLSFQLGLKQ